MRKTDILRFAFSNFLRRKARSMLTVLGVVIGTAAVVIMLSIGIGMNKGFEDQISSYSNLKQITIYSYGGSYQYDEDSGTYVYTESNTVLDDIAIDEISEIDHVQTVSPYLYYWGYLIMDNTEKCSSMSIIGIDAASMADMGYEILYGRLLDESDIGTTNFVMTYALPFYFYTMREEDEIWWKTITEDDELPFNPVGSNHTYKFTWYWSYGESAVDTSRPKIELEEGNCVGILAYNESGNYETYVYMDVNGVFALEDVFEENQAKYYGYDYTPEDRESTENNRRNIYDQAIVLVEDSKYVQGVEAKLNEMGYETYSSMEYLTQLQDQTKFLRAILGAIGVVAFIVAAISIANTMVMSIYERTREIGIMKVLGCKLSDIRGMFLIEAGIIGAVGGVLGVLFSYGASAAVNYLASAGGMSMLGIDASTSALSVIPPWLDGVAILLAIAVGVVSGLYPAIRATRLSALEAIKNE